MRPVDYQARGARNSIPSSRAQELQRKLCGKSGHISDGHGILVVAPTKVLMWDPCPFGLPVVLAGDSGTHVLRTALRPKTYSRRNLESY